MPQAKHHELASKLCTVARLHLKITDLQIANQVGVDRIVVKNLRRRLKLKRFKPARKYFGDTQKERNLAAVKRYRQGKPDIDHKAQANQRLKYKVQVLDAYGAWCHNPEASQNTCSSQLEAHHTHFDGGRHRRALGRTRPCNALTMYKFIWKVLTLGPQTDRTGKEWNVADFTILCRSHNLHAKANQETCINVEVKEEYQWLTQ